MKNEERSSLIAKRLAQMEGNAPPTSPPEIISAPPAPPERRYSPEAVRQNSPDEHFTSSYTRYLVLGMAAVVLFSAAGIYYVFSSQPAVEPYPPAISPEYSDSGASGTTTEESSLAAEVDSDQQYYKFARSVAGKEDPFVAPDSPLLKEPSPLPPPAPKVSISLLGTIIDEPKMALLEIAEQGKTKRIKAKEGESMEGFTVKKIEKGSILLDRSEESFQLTLGAATELTK